MRRLSLFVGAMVVAAACSKGGSSGSYASSGTGGGVACDTLRRDVALFGQYAQKIDQALGSFNDIRVFERRADSGAWRLVSGWYVPVTIGGATPDYYVRHMDSDRPMMLPTTVQSDTAGVDDDGQSMPYSSLGRMPGTNPEVQWIWVVRQYKIKDTTAADFPHSGHGRHRPPSANRCQRLSAVLRAELPQVGRGGGGAFESWRGRVLVADGQPHSQLPLRAVPHGRPVHPLAVDQPGHDRRW